MNDIGAWLIGLAFYAPIHFLGPLLVLLLTGPADGAARSARLRATLIECTLTMVVAFALAVPLFRSHPGWAAAILGVAMFVPYTHLYFARERTPPAE